MTHDEILAETVKYASMKKKIHLRPDEHWYNNVIVDKHGTHRGKLDTKTGKVIRGNVEKKPDEDKETSSKSDKESPKDDITSTSSKSDVSIGSNPYKEQKVVADLKKLADMANEAKAKGKDAPDFDLCKVTIPGTNLFCQVNKNIPRKKMPQLIGKPVEGSEASKIKADDKGEVNVQDQFEKQLEKEGHKVKTGSIDASKLKSTQSQLVGAKVAGMLEALKKNPSNPGITAPIFISKDGYILDGHHRWAAVVGLDMADGKNKPVKMKVKQIDMNIEDLVKYTNKFASDVGIAQKAGQVKESAQTQYINVATKYLY